MLWRLLQIPAFAAKASPLGADMQKLRVVESKRGRGHGIAQNIVFESGKAFVTGAYSSIEWQEKEALIARLARVWNITSGLSDESLSILEAHLTTNAADKCQHCGFYLIASETACPKCGTCR